jgi:hypothetical protein
MKLILKSIIALTLFVACAARTRAESVSIQDGWSLNVDPNRGEYQLTTVDPKWSVGGSIAKQLDGVSTEQGKDNIGAYHLIRFNWQDGGRRSGSIRLYDSRPLALFSVRYEEAVNGSPAPFPVLSKLPANLLAFRYGETDHLRPELFHLAGSEPDEQYGGPFALFDTQANTLILSPASNFMVAMMSGDLQHGISSGLNRTLTGVPAGYEQQTLLAIGQGINHTWTDWGNGLTDHYAKKRPANDADTGLKYLGYWTDNGSHYYYNYDSDKGYTGTLLAVKDYLLKREIPIHYMQLDSWWYPKTFDSVQKKESNKPRSKDPKLPNGSWNRYGGLLEFTAAKELFPQGLGAFQQQLGLPLIVHNRWIDPKSPYHNTYKVSGIAGVDPGWWDKITSDISSWGVATYEQDWNNWIYLESPELSNTTWAGDAYMDGMAHACAAHNLTMQYCMVMPRFLLQGGAKYPNLTTVRVSGDRLDRGKWHEFIYGSTLAGALGVWPWTDVYRSSETPNILLSTLSAGMVGLSDRMGDENVVNISHTIRKDGVIVKPDVPLTPTDASFIAEASASSESSAVVCSTHSDNGGQVASYVFAFTRDAKKPQDTSWTVAPQSLGIAGSAIAYDFATGAVQPIDVQHSLTGRLDKDHDWTYRVVVPVGRSGMALVGDANLFITRGRQRIASVIDEDGKTLHTTVLLARGELAITLTVYSPSQPVAEVKGGSVGDIAYDANTRLAKVQVKIDPVSPQQDVNLLEVTFKLQ